MRSDPETKMFGGAFLLIGLGFGMLGIIIAQNVSAIAGWAILGLSGLSTLLSVLFLVALLGQTRDNLREARAMQRELAWRAEDEQGQE